MKVSHANNFRPKIVRRANDATVIFCRQQRREQRRQQRREQRRQQRREQRRQ